MHKNQTENFASAKQRKREKRTRFGPKKAKPGAFWVLEGMRAVAGRCKRKRNVREKGRTCLGCRLGRRWTVATGDQRPTTRTAGGPAGAPRCQILPHTNEKSQVPQKRYLTFLAGAEGLEPSARGFGVGVGKRTGERGRASVGRFLPQVTKRAVLVWCYGKF